MVSIGFVVMIGYLVPGSNGGAMIVGTVLVVVGLQE